MLNTHVKMSNDQEDEAANSAPSNDAASARKRRKLIIQSQRSEAELPASDGNAAGSSDGASDSSVKSEGGQQQPSKKSRQGEEDKSSESRQNRTQVKYNPDIPMSKEQLAAWRREARRVRNRESAAASRQRIRNRISELEDEVSDTTLVMGQLISVW
jgi:bZIP transcription factor